MLTQQIKILYITLRADHGGGPKHLYDLLTTLPENIEAFVATPADKPYYHRFTELAGEDHITEVPHRAFRVPVLMQLRNYCTANKISLIHSHGKGAGIYSRLLNILTGIPVIHTFHGIHIDNYSPLKKQLYLLLERFLSVFTRAGISVSDSEQKRITSLGFFPLAKLHTIFNGVAIPASVTPRTVTTGIKNILHITRFDFAKDPDLLFAIIEHFRNENDFRFIIIGEGEGKDRIENSVLKKRLGHIVQFTGAVDNPADYFADAFCYLSSSRWEGLPLSVLEAMANGIPPVLTNVTGNTDCVEEGISGFLFNRESPADAAEKIRSLAKDADRYTAVSKAARLRAEQKYSLKVMGEKTINLYLAVPKDI